MISQGPNNIVELLQLAIDVGVIKNDKIVTAAKWHELEVLASATVKVAEVESKASKEAWEEELIEHRVGVESGVKDVGQDDYVGDKLHRPDVSRRLENALKAATISDEGNMVVPSCFYILCKHLGVATKAHCYSVAELSGTEVKKLRDTTEVMIGYTTYSDDDARNHVVPVIGGSRTGVVNMHIAGGDGHDDCIHGITSPQEFFNPGGRFYRTKFYADNGSGQVQDPNDQSSMAGTGFGADTTGTEATGYQAFAGGPHANPATGQAGRETAAGAHGGPFGGFGQGGQGSRVTSGSRTGFPPPPESVADYDVASGSANTSGGVVRSKKRVIAARGTHEKDVSALRSYKVTGVTMFNNVDELYLDTISRSFAQEILEDLFDVWGVPKDEPESVTYAEDLVWLFIIARTASNKADYNVAFDVPTKKEPVEADFSKLSNLLTSKYGVTRRNFSRGVADDLRAYLNRAENQFVKTKSAARIYADPQYGDLSFDGSTGCTGMTTSEQRFTKLLEDRNLYERADVRADGASDVLMQGIHGGTRSVVQR